MHAGAGGLWRRQRADREADGDQAHRDGDHHQGAPKPTIAAPTGTPAPEALSQFQCAKDAKGVWNASGTIANSGKSKATYQVTVYVGEAAGSDEQAMTKQLPNIEARGSVKFAIVKVPAPKDGGTVSRAGPPPVIVRC